MAEAHGVPDCTWILVTMEDGTVFTIGASWALPPGLSALPGEKGARSFPAPGDRVGWAAR
jgi:hypothetical protein